MINSEIHYDAKGTMDSDNLARAVNYKNISKAIIQHVESKRFLLLEKLVNDVLNICCEADAINYAR